MKIREKTKRERERASEPAPPRIREKTRRTPEPPPTVREKTKRPGEGQMLIWTVREAKMGGQNHMRRRTIDEPETPTTCWTADYRQAVWFLRKEDAEGCIGWFRKNTKHNWEINLKAVSYIINKEDLS